MNIFWWFLFWWSLWSMDYMLNQYWALLTIRSGWKMVMKIVIFWIISFKIGNFLCHFWTTYHSQNKPIFLQAVVLVSKNSTEKESSKNVHPLEQGKSPKVINLSAKWSTWAFQTVQTRTRKKRGEKRQHSGLCLCSASLCRCPFSRRAVFCSHTENGNFLALVWSCAATAWGCTQQHSACAPLSSAAM